VQHGIESLLFILSNYMTDDNTKTGLLDEYANFMELLSEVKIIT